MFFAAENMHIIRVVKMILTQFPKWMIKNRGNFPYAFRNLRCKGGFNIAVRVGFDGVITYGKNGIAPNFFIMSQETFASFEDFKGHSGEGFRPFEVGCVSLNGHPWFAECFYYPGLLEEDFIELQAVLLTFYQMSKGNEQASYKGVSEDSSPLILINNLIINLED
ncbi:hypothetical protein [Cytobacillus firmus]|uniref:hypothetical protein n=1 Tax=Cytobacillus firmus TaxID=1399 RepID=UPI0030017F52